MSMQKSLKIGGIGEDRVINMLRSVGITTSKNDDKETREFYDLACEYDGVNFTCEVKFDVMSEKTGNVAIEVFNSKSNKPSGIFGTKADIWIHVLPDDSNLVVCICSVKKIRQYSREATPFRILKSVGDNNADLILYKVEDVLENLFNRIDNIGNDEILKTVKKLVGNKKWQ